MIDSDRFRFTGDRILDRFERDLKIVAQTDGTFQAVEAKVERHETRLQERAESRGQDLEGKAAGFAGSDLKQRLAVFRRRFLVDEKDHRPVALVNGVRPLGGEAKKCAIE